MRSLNIRVLDDIESSSEMRQRNRNIDFLIQHILMPEDSSA